MAYADVIRSANYTREDLADLIDGALVLDYDSYSSAALVSSTSEVTSNASLTVTAAAGQMVIFHFASNFSNSIGNQAFFRVWKNGTAWTYYHYTHSDTSSASGQEANWSITLFDIGPVSGSNTYTLYFGSDGGSGTTYIKDKYGYAIVLTEGF